MNTRKSPNILRVANQLLHIDSLANQDDFAGYLCRRLPDDQLRFWDSHLEGCSRCREAVAELKAIDDDAVAHSLARHQARVPSVTSSRSPDHAPVVQGNGTPALANPGAATLDAAAAWAASAWAEFIDAVRREASALLAGLSHEPATVRLSSKPKASVEDFDHDRKPPITRCYMPSDQCLGTPARDWAFALGRDGTDAILLYVVTGLGDQFDVSALQFDLFHGEELVGRLPAAERYGTSRWILRIDFRHHKEHHNKTLELEDYPALSVRAPNITLSLMQFRRLSARITR